MYDQPVIAEQKLPIPVENLKQHYLRMHADEDFLFKEEYKVERVWKYMCNLDQVGG